MKQLACDLGVQVRGHNLGYILNIVKLLEQHELVDSREIIFLFNLTVSSYLENIHNKYVNILYINDEENTLLEQCQQLTERRAVEWKLIKKYAGEYAIDEVIILEIDQYQLSIGSETTPFKVSGIYFRPHYRIETIGSGLANRVKYWLWRQKKLALEYYMCRNKSLHNIYILNDERAVQAMNQRICNVFRYLPDPIYNYEPALIPISQLYNIPQDRFVFLIFGAIDERKNIEIIFQAFARLSPEQARKATLLVVGRVKADYKKALASVTNILTNGQPSLQLITDDRFIDNSEMETLFAECNVPLLLYRDFFVSSGLLGIAAKYNKPVLSSTYGVLGELTKKYQLGHCLSPKDVEGIASYLVQLLTQRSPLQVDGQPYYLSHTPNDFLNRLFSLSEQNASNNY
ncbi:glycosyltransferase [Spirosoma fluminis]